MKTLIRTIQVSLISGISLILFACGSNIKLDTPMALTENAISEARSAGAEEHAPLQLYNAEEKLKKSKDAAQNGDKEYAQRLLEEAKLDAELAKMKSEADKREKAVSQLKEGNQTLIKELAQ